MKAAILVKSRKPLVLGDLELPKNLTYGQVKVKVFYSGICGLTNEIDAVKGKDKFLPHLLGHEGSGIVEEIGNGVKNVKPGDQCSVTLVVPKVLEFRAPLLNINGKKAKKELTQDGSNTFNEKTIVSENRVTKFLKILI